MPETSVYLSIYIKATNWLGWGVVVGRRGYLSSKIKHYREENVVQELCSQNFHEFSLAVLDCCLLKSMSPKRVLLAGHNPNNLTTCPEFEEQW